MKKGLLTAFVLASVLVFNACKKEEGPQGPVGPVGPQGPAGAVGPQGATGAAGTNGKDGATIRAAAGAPAATLGNNGDFYFDTTAKVLYGPKADGAWPATGTSLQGPKGDRAGASVIAGATLPADLKEGDYWFNTTNSTVYGPYDADGNYANQIPLGAGGSKTYVLNLTFQNVKEKTTATGASVRLNSEKVDIAWGPFETISQYKVTEADVNRMQYHNNWAENREMVFQATPGGAWTSIPTSHTQLGTPPFDVGAKFRFTANTANPTHEFTLTQEDINRLKDNNGASFGYLTYAKVDPATMSLGQTMNFARTKIVTRSADPANFKTEYSATTTIDLSTVAPELEKAKKDGAYVFVGYNFYNYNYGQTSIATNARTNNTLVQNPLGAANRGYYDLTAYVNTYINPGVTYGEGVTSVAVYNGANPYAAHPAYPAASVQAYAGAPGQFGVSPIEFAYGTVAIPSIVNLPLGTTGQNQNQVNGRLHINWDIVSGQTLGANGTINDAANANTRARIVVGPTTGSGVAGNLAVRTWATDYYSGSSLSFPSNIGHNTTLAGFLVQANGTKAWEKNAFSVAGGTTSTVEALTRWGGLTAEQIAAHKLLRLVVNVVPAQVVAQAKAAGIDVNNPEALVNFANSLQ